MWIDRKELLRQLMHRYSFEVAHAIIQVTIECRGFENDNVYIMMTRTRYGDNFKLKWKTL